MPARMRINIRDKGHRRTESLFPDAFTEISDPKNTRETIGAGFA